MSTNANQAPRAGLNNTRACRSVVAFREVVAIGAAGAASQEATQGQSPGYDDPGFTCTNGGAGIFTLTFPAGLRAWFEVEVYSPALTVVSCVTTAKSATAGTATIKTLNAAGAATNPASGDKLFIKIEVEAL